MKKIVFLLFVFMLIISCKMPKLLKQDNADYKIIDWEAGKFYYATYHWSGKDFSEAINIIKEFVDISKKGRLMKPQSEDFRKAKTGSSG